MLGVFSAALFSAGEARAFDFGAGAPGPTIDVHGFASEGYIKSTGSDYLVASLGGGSFEYSEAGLNFTSQLTDKMRVGFQLFAYDLGSLGNYITRADWFYLDYRLKDEIGVRAGRVKLAYGLYNDISDVDAARTTVLLPTSIYPPTNRDFFLGVTGGEAYGFFDLRRAGALEYRAIGGAVNIDIPRQVGAMEQVASLDVPYLAAGRLMWEAPVNGLRVGVSALVLRVDESAIFATMPAGPALTLRDTVWSALGSAEYAAHDLVLAAEYGQTRSVLSDNEPAIAPEGATVSEAGYVAGSYRVTRWLQPAAYGSVYFPNRNQRSGRQNYQDDLAGTLRFDLNGFWILKLEGHYMRGTAEASTANRILAPEDWALFLVKTTAYF